MKLNEKIQEILDSSITSYRISKMSGVTESSIGAMRRGERKVENMQLGIAEKLGQFYDEEMADMSMETIQIILSEAFKEIGVKPFIDTDDEKIIIEFDLPGNDDPVRFAVYTSEITTKDDVLQNLGQALRDFDTQEEDGYYPSLYSDQATNPESVTAEYMPISKESSDYLAGLGKKILNLE